MICSASREAVTAASSAASCSARMRSATKPTPRPRAARRARSGGRERRCDRMWQPSARAEPDAHPASKTVCVNVAPNDHNKVEAETSLAKFSRAGPVFGRQLNIGVKRRRADPDRGIGGGHSAFRSGDIRPALQQVRRQPRRDFPAIPEVPAPAPCSPPMAACRSARRSRFQAGSRWNPRSQSRGPACFRPVVRACATSAAETIPALYWFWVIRSDLV